MDALPLPAAREAAADFLDAQFRFAERAAVLVGTYLEHLGVIGQGRARKPVALPEGFLLELGAVLQIGLWERDGLRSHLTGHLPGFDAALADLFDRFANAPKDFLSGRSYPELCRRVSTAWISSCALAAPAEVGVDLALAGDLDNELLEALADFCWRFRHLEPEETP